MTASFDIHTSVPPIRPPERAGKGASRRGLLFGSVSLGLFLCLGTAGAGIPLWQGLNTPAPWMAKVTLSVSSSDPNLRTAALERGVRALSGSNALGRAVDILALDQDPEFNGVETSALGIAMELLAGEGTGPGDARSRAISALASDIFVEKDQTGEGATLRVRASEPAKAERIAEALASVFSAATEQTASIASVEKDTAGLQKAEAALAAFRASVGEERLSTALVVQKRLDGLDSHLAEFSDLSGKTADPLAAASLEDVLSGRVAGGVTDMRIDRLRQDYLGARMTADTLAVSLGPKHPQLVVAKNAAEDARKALAQGLSTYRQTATVRARTRKAALDDLQKQRHALQEAVTQTGVDLARYDALERTVEAARADLQRAPEPAPRSSPIYEASAVEPLPVPQGLSLPWRVALGALSGLGAAFAFTRALRTRRLDSFAQAMTGAVERGQIEPKARPAQSRSALASDALVSATPVIAEPVPSRYAALEPSPPIGQPKAVHRHHRAANEAQDMPQVATYRSATRQAHRMPYGLAETRQAPPPPAFSDVPTVLKLRHVAPHLFDEPSEPDGADVERLRQELAALRARVLRRVGGRN